MQTARGDVSGCQWSANPAGSCNGVSTIVDGPSHKTTYAQRHATSHAEDGDAASRSRAPLGSVRSSLRKQATDALREMPEPCRRALQSRGRPALNRPGRAPLLHSACWVVRRHASYSAGKKDGHTHARQRTAQQRSERSTHMHTKAIGPGCRSRHGAREALHGRRIPAPAQGARRRAKLKTDGPEQRPGGPAILETLPALERV